MEAKFNAEVNPRIKKLTDLFKIDVHDIRVLRTKVDTEFTRKEKRLFATEGASGGAKWKPLSPAYQKRKRKKRPGRKILTYDGTLRKSLTQKSHPDHVATSQLTPKRATITVGTSVEYGAYHAPGVLHNKRLPVRDPIQMTQAQRKDYSQLVWSYFVDEKLDRVKRVLLAWSKRSG